jgi:long-chain acyl-CoA synthetase
VTYAELEARSNQVAWLARRCGLRPGDGLAVITKNRPELLEAAWGAQRSGLQFTAVNWHLTAEKAGYVVRDSGARMVVVSYQLAGLAAQLGPVLAPGVRRLMIGPIPAAVVAVFMITKSFPPFSGGKVFVITAAGGG